MGSRRVLRGGPPKQRLIVIRESAAEVVPAVITAVSTTVVSFLPVFFLTGRDHRLFAPLAWTKTFALVSSLIVAVAVVPALCRVLLTQSSRVPRWVSLADWNLICHVGIGPVSLCLGRPRCNGGLSIKPAHCYRDCRTCRIRCRLVDDARAKVRSMEENPTSRFVRFLYAGRLKIALKHKLLMLSFPTCDRSAGSRSLDWVARRCCVPSKRSFLVLGADLNERAGVCRRQTHVHGSNNRRLDRAG